MKVQPLLKKCIISAILLLLGVFSYTGFLNTLFVEKTFVHTIDRDANMYLDRTMKKALYTYAIVRGINAVISVVQDSDVSVSPAGVGVTVAIGEILDPLNDLIERFSWVVLASTTSLGIQKILMNVGIWLGFRVLLFLSLIVLFLDVWFAGFLKWDLQKLGFHLIIFSVLIRFCIPAVAFVTSRIDTLFLEDRYHRATESLEEVSTEIEANHSQMDQNKRNLNLIQKVQNFFKNIEIASNIEEKIQTLKDTISGYIDYIIDLIVVFIFQTIIIPIIIFWILIKLFGKVLGMDLIEKFKPIFRKSLSVGKVT